MANYASLWTSGSDKEFRQMSKFHSLQRRRLGLEMTGIRKEHARHVKRVRVEMREAGTLASQYEDEKERRARHLLKTFSKVQRKRQAADDWKTAVRQRNNSVATPSPTFDVEIGAKEAPWGGTGRSLSSSRRKSSTGSFSSMRARRGSRASSLGSIKGGAAAAKTQPRRVSGLFGSPARLPPIGRGGMSQYMTLATIPIFLNTWQAALGRRQSQAGVPDEDADSHVTVAVEGDARGNGEFVNDDDQLRLDSDGSPERTAARADPGPLKRKVYWTETFPFVYHSVGETVCPRYHKLFHQYEEFKVQPPKRTSRRMKSVTSASHAAAPAQSDTGSRLSFRSLSQTLRAIGALTSEVSTLSLANTDYDIDPGI